MIIKIIKALLYGFCILKQQSVQEIAVNKLVRALFADVCERFQKHICN